MKKYSSILATVSIVFTIALSLPSCTPKIGCYYFTQTSNPKTPGLNCEENQICSGFSVENKTTSIENGKATSN